MRHHADGGVSFAFEGVDGLLIVGAARTRLIVFSHGVVLGYSLDGELREALVADGPRPPLKQLGRLAPQRAAAARWC